MQGFAKSVLPLVEAHLSQFTPVERKIADFFLQAPQGKDEDFSGKSFAQYLGVSEAALTRFAKKCGFRGFREWVYAYTQPEPISDNDFVQPVLASYQELLNKTYSIVDMRQIHRITQLLLNKKRVYIYGKGSSGMVAQEMRFRFMRIGLICEAITDDDMILMSKVLLDTECLVIGISISGKSRIVIDALHAAKDEGAATVLFTASADESFLRSFDVVQLFAVRNQLEYGRMISPQFPVLIVLDMLYADYMNTDKERRDRIWQRTYDVLQQNKR
ncbi:MAG: MurR/RpiR family transcriptional regulator [Cardiobacteriaceae bacterium]|nr:MurR/RpiR family transcriptional regulator [Cardiobacteriaceae bacterium]